MKRKEKVCSEGNINWQLKNYREDINGIGDHYAST